MNRVVVDLGQLEVAARRLGQAGADLGETAFHVDRLAVRLPPPLAALYRDASWPVQRGLAAHAEALDRLAAALRLVGRAVELASAGGLDPGLAAMGAADFAKRRRRGLPPAPPPSPAGGGEPTDEELLRWLRQHAGWHLLTAPGGLTRLQLTATGDVSDRSTSGAGPAAVAVVALLGLLFAARAMSGSAGTAVQPTSPAPARTRNPKCDAKPPSDDVDGAKKVLLNPRDIDAARRESKGEVVKAKPDGTAYDHVQKYKQEQNRVRKQLDKLKWIMREDTCTPEDKTAAERKLSEASRLLDWSEKNVVPKP